MKRVGIKDVAKIAGVSTTTVSYVLNEREGETFSQETIERVHAAAQQLGYVPSQSARSLISRESKLIGVVIPQTEPGKEFMFSNPFYGELLSAIEFEAREHGYHLLITGTDIDQSYFPIARNRDVDGIVIVGTYPGKQLDELKQMEVPVVLVDSYVKDPYFHTIGIEDREGARMATQYLIDKGHREIAFVSGSVREYGVNEKRYQGYLDALKQAGIAPNERHLYIGNVDHHFGVEAACELVSRRAGESAAFVSADVLAMGLLKGLRQHGLRVPEDISVIGFDDVYLSEMCDPSLTTVRQDIRQKGRKAAAFLIEAAGAHRRERLELILPLQIVERDSVMDITKRTLHADFLISELKKEERHP